MENSSSVKDFSEGDKNCKSNEDVKINKSPLMNSDDLDRMVAESMKDVSSEEDDDDLESDKELMRQLQEITQGSLKEAKEQNQETNPSLSTSSLTTIDVLKQRINMYRMGKSNAETAGDDAKVRRLGRGLLRLTEMLKQTKAGEQIVTDEIPPEVTTKPADEKRPSDKT